MMSYEKSGDEGPASSQFTGRQTYTGTMTLPSATAGLGLLTA